MKEVDTFATHKEGKNMKSAGFAFFALLMLVCSSLTSIPAMAVVIDPSNGLDEVEITEKMGRTLLIEEVTTTWCPTCADIDPYLKGVADAHGSRIAMVAYHPTDGEDAFQPEAAQHRIERLGIEHGNSLSSPTFFVEGMNPRTGIDAWSDVQRDILNAETGRQDTSTLQFEVVRNGTEITAKVLSFDSPEMNLSGTQLTFLVLEHDKEVPEDSINPGGKTRDRVLVATSECTIENSSIDVNIGLHEASVSQSCDVDFSITFEQMEQFSIILVHENTLEQIHDKDASLGTYGSVEFAYRTRESNEQSWPLLSGMIALAFTGGIWAILPRKDQKS